MRSQGHRVTVSLPERGGATREKLLSRGCQWLEQVEWLPWIGGLGPSMLNAAAEMRRKCVADEVFFACIDEWASGTLRRAALGLRPAKSLKGRISGIYVRPRPLDPEYQPRGVSAWLKRKGWWQLDKQGWFQQIIVLDERLPDHPRRARGKCQVSFMPEPSGKTSESRPSQNEARKQLGIPTHAVVFLHYGLGTRRKGLHHVLAAWKKLPAKQHALLLVAGEPEPEFLEPIRQLQATGQAVLLDRYIGSEEERLVMAASDVVLMPYVNHYGSSNVLSRAAAAGRMVLASDQGLIGYRVRRYKMGELCAHDDAESLRQAVVRLMVSNPEHVQSKYADALKIFTASMSSDRIKLLFATATDDTR